MSDKAAAASKREKALAGLKTEREGYVRSGNADRVREVDEQIKAHGGKPVGRRAPEVGNTAARNEA